ncbi:MAG: hypothetical protein WDN23_10300 [Edaphobacter sp.]
MQQLFTFRPSLLMTNLMRWATPHNCTDGAENDFKSDAAWFKAHKYRHQVIRKASFAEFNTFETWQACGALGLPHPPQLWSMVIRTGAANHLIIPVWLGDACFPTDNSIPRYDSCESDDALQVILHHINHNNGFDPIEFLEFTHKTQLALQAATAAKNRAGKLN